jgi:hypothetical protein
VAKVIASYAHHQATGSPVVNGMRSDLNAGNRVCGCGEPAQYVFYLATFRVKNGRRDLRTNRVPLCARHSEAHSVQRRRRVAAISRTWQRAS